MAPAEDFAGGGPGRLLLVRPVHGALQADAALAHDDLDAVVRHPGAPVQGLPDRPGQLALATGTCFPNDWGR